MRIIEKQAYTICWGSLSNLSYGKAPHMESTYERGFFQIRCFKDKPYNERGITSVVSILDNTVFIDPRYNTKHRGKYFIEDIIKKLDDKKILYKLEVPSKSNLSN